MWCSIAAFSGTRPSKNWDAGACVNVSGPMTIPASWARRCRRVAGSVVLVVAVPGHPGDLVVGAVGAVGGDVALEDLRLDPGARHAGGGCLVAVGLDLDLALALVGTSAPPERDDEPAVVGQVHPRLVVLVVVGAG